MRLKNRVLLWVLSKQWLAVNHESEYQGEAIDMIWFIVGGIVIVALVYFLWPTLQSYGTQFLTLMWNKITGLLS